MCREAPGSVAQCRGLNFFRGRKTMYQALYRKWRPATFSQVVGQEHITSTLQRQVAEGRTAHAYLFTGTRGTGKTTCARILAKAVNCLEPIDGAPCCKCDACRGIESGSLLDVTELDAASNNGVDQVRALREEAVYTPSVLRKRVYIIDEVHMLSTAAFNALLKILEEPPEHLLFILATTELHKVPATILSRCQRFSFKRILPRDMEKQLLSIAKEEGIDLTADGAEILCRMANGALRDALSLLDQCRVAETVDTKAVLNILGLAGSAQTVQLMQCLLAENGADALSLFDKLYRDGKDVSALLGELSDLGREMTILKAAPEGGQALLSGLYDKKTLSALSGNASMARCLHMTSTLQACCATLGDSARPRTDAELCLLKLCDATLCGDVTALAARMDKVEEAVKKGVKIAVSAPVLAQKQPEMTQKTAPKTEDTAPWDDRPPLEEPPLMDESNRWFDEPVKEAPRPASAEKAPYASPVPAPAKQEAAAPAGDGDVWERLIEHYKGRLPIYQRPFLNMARGVLEGDCLTIYCRDDFAKTSIDNKALLDVVKEVTEKEVGRTLRIAVTVGNVAAAPKKAAPAAKPAPKKEAPAPAPAPVEERPPWEEPPAPSASHDALDELISKGKTLDTFKIKGE